MTGSWSVSVERGTVQGGESFDAAVARAASAHQRRLRWDARVHDGRSWRVLNDQEAAKLVSAITEELA